jgi:hypothetical protein
MTQPEFLAWREFYRLFPFDDLHRYHRPAALISSTQFGSTDDVQRAFARRLDFLQPDPATAGMTHADVTTLEAFGLRRG